MPRRSQPASRLHEAARGTGYLLLYGGMVLVAGLIVTLLFTWLM